MCQEGVTVTLRVKWWPLALTVLLAVGCGTSTAGAAASGSGQQDYGTTKQMVIDILHSPDGKTAVESILKDPSIKSQIIVSDTDIAKAVENSLKSKQNQSFLSKQAKDPEFADALAKAVQPELISITKQLMKDPTYQKEMLVLLQSPEFSTHLQTLMKSPQYRGQVMQIMTDALQTPSFRMQFQDMLKKAVEQSMQSAGGQSQSQGGGSQSSGGSGGGGSGGGGSGGGGSGGGGGS